jgi:hypothetical protein
MNRLILISDLHNIAHQLEKKVFQIVYLNHQRVNTKVLVSPETLRLHGEIDNLYSDLATWKNHVEINLRTDGGKNLIFR